MNMLCYTVWQGELEVADGINVVNHLTLRWGDCPELSGWAQCNHKSPCKRRQEDLSLVDVKTEARGWNNPRKEPQNISSP